MNESSFTSGLHVSLGFLQPKVISALAQSSSSRGNLCLHHAKRSVLQAREDILKQGSPSPLQGQNTPALRRTSNRLEFDLQQGAERTRPKAFAALPSPFAAAVGRTLALAKGPGPHQGGGKENGPCRSSPPLLAPRTRAGSLRYGLVLGLCRGAQRPA